MTGIQKTHVPHYTAVVVAGDPNPGPLKSDRYEDRVWNTCFIDGGNMEVIKVTIRCLRQRIDELPIRVYLDGCVPLYPTYVYDSQGNLLAMDPGKLIMGDY